MDHCAGQRFPLLDQRLAAYAHLLERGLKRGQRGRVPPDPGAAQRPDARAGPAQFVAAVI